MLKVDDLEVRKEKLQSLLAGSAEQLKDLQERAKCIKKEINNVKGAILELDYLIECM